MPTLSNPKWEAFARAVVQGRPASHAYARAYKVSGNAAEVNGCKLLRNTKVANRVAELKSKAATRTEKTVASLVAELDDVIVFARQCHNPSAMIAAIAQQSRLLGLEAPRQLEIAHKPAPLPTRTLELSVEEWTAQFSTPLRLPEPSRPPTLLKHTRAEKHPKAPVVEQIIVRPPELTETPIWVPGEICLDDEL
ncbi:MAG: terminase small subunit [Phyllobacterium sp.]|uniref:terminase small subunit n=1 Tax=Phyllobacterium sp. TaxID=1871046 RepID=UPI0030F24494